MEINDIILITENVIFETDLKVLLNDPFIENIVRYNHEYVESRATSYHDSKHRNHIMMFINNLYDNFKFLLTHIDDYQQLVNFLCDFQSQNLRYLDAMVLQYDVPTSPVLDMFINKVHKQLDDTGVSTFSYNYKKKQFKLLSDSYVELISLPDTKSKLSGFISLEAEIKSVYLSKSFKDNGEDLIKQVEVQISKLQKMLDLNLLPDADNKVQTPNSSKLDYAEKDETIIQKNNEFTTRRQVLAMYYIFELIGCTSATVDKTAQARFIHFLTGKSYTDVYKKISKPFKGLENENNKSTIEDSKFLIKQFTDLRLNEIIVKIKKDMKI